jgi:lysophospholipase L1-like esterase
MSTQKKSVKSPFVFWLFLCSPLLFLVLLIGYFGWQIHAINTVDYKALENHLASYLEQKEGVDQPLPKLPEDTSSNYIFTFGASSVVVSSGNTFSQFLETALIKEQCHAKVINFGVPGLDSYSIKRRVKQALDSTAVLPKLAIFYLGHNDFNNAYDKVLKPAFPRFDLLLQPMHFFYKRQDDFQEGMTYPYYCRLKNPEIIDYLQQLSLTTIHDPIHGRYDSLILHHFKQNLNEALFQFTSRNIPVLLLTPIGNVYAKPVGNREKVSDTYMAGLKENDYLAAYRLLKSAQNNELLTYDVRAKSDLNSYLKSLNEPLVNVLDLEGRLVESRFAFDDSHFLDYFHLNEKAHAAISQLIQSKLMQMPGVMEQLKRRENREEKRTD